MEPGRRGKDRLEASLARPVGQPLTDGVVVGNQVVLGQAEGIADLRVGQVKGDKTLEADRADAPDDLERVDVLLGVVAEELGPGRIVR